MRIIVITIVITVLLFSYLWIYNNIENKRVIRTNKEITILLSQHPYVEAIISELDAFSKKTGINVVYNIVPEDNYYNIMKARLERGYGEPDVIMTGPYFIWELSSEHMLEDLTPYYKDQTENYNIDDFLPNVLEIYRYSQGDSIKTYGLPLGFEVAVLAYNKRIFDELNIEVPKTYDELLKVCEYIKNLKDDKLYALAIRGRDDWAMLNTGYISMYANYLLPENKHLDLTERLTEKGSIAMNELWLKIVKAGSSSELDEATWGVASADFGSGRAAMLFDMDNVAYYQNMKGESNEAGNIAWTTVPTIKAGDPFVSNLWSWGLSMNRDSHSKDAAWAFINYFTSEDFVFTAATKYKLVLPARRTVIESEKFMDIIEKNAGYRKTLDETIPRSKVLLSKNDKIIDILNLWSKTIKYIQRESTGISEQMEQLQLSIGDIYTDNQ
ncbi:ABC transporter substrate-binding protein [Cellulosilyticum sp. I15G10I2]|uniref:ABC transporter substrate-binding protein n=1 Tax=Cellulosilyticum sp. I15G10I2 TaxID=1892843 RepID=UPI00114CCFCE|nr:extracellular solute-binding protein [Cellulosilyticum sp. I15G10I2]